MLEIEMVRLTDEIPEQRGAVRAGAIAGTEIARKHAFEASSPCPEQLAETSARYAIPKTEDSFFFHATSGDTSPTRSASAEEELVLGKAGGKRVSTSTLAITNPPVAGTLPHGSNAVGAMRVLCNGGRYGTLARKGFNRDPHRVKDLGRLESVHNIVSCSLNTKWL